MVVVKVDVKLVVKVGGDEGGGAEGSGEGGGEVFCVSGEKDVGGDSGNVERVRAASESSSN